MKLTRIFAVLFLILFSCQTTAIKTQQNTSASYEEGYKHGWMTARLVSGDTKYTYKKDKNKYSNNSEYAKGWKEGYNKNVIQMENNEIREKALKLAQCDSEQQEMELKAYFRWKENKAFTLNPNNRKQYSWSYGYSSIVRAKEKALSLCGVGCELFAVNDKIVWQYSNEATYSGAKGAFTKTPDNSYIFDQNITTKSFLAWKPFNISTKNNFEMDFNIRKQSGGAENYSAYGIIWGGKDNHNYHSFIINSGGKYTYGSMVDNKWYEIIGWTSSQYINKYNSTNKLSLKKLGDSIEFWINDNYVNKTKFEIFFGSNAGFILNKDIKVEIEKDIVVREKSLNNTSNIAQQKIEPQQNWQYLSTSQPKPAEPKNQPTTQLTQTAQHQIQQPQAIQQQQQTTVYAKPQLADRRIALVIGNEKYINAPLENTVNDSHAVGNVLKRLGFKTLQYENLGQKEMKRAIDDFGTQLKNYDVGLFFYSGHGTQIKGENYLIPIDAAPKSENEVDYDCLPAGRVLAKMEDSGSVTNIIILDACRNNPSERSWSRSPQSKGLVFMNAPSGSLIAYATSPGKIAFDKSSQKNSPYTSALLKHIETPNISIVEMFQRVRVTVEDETEKEQTPWESTSLRDNFYFYRADGQ